MSAQTLNKTFFDNLWPLILFDNICDTHSKNTSEFFEPTPKFDHIWAHELLAARGFKNYQKVIEFKMNYPEEEIVKDRRDEQSDDDECVAVRPQHVVSMVERNHELHKEQERRQQLAYDFVNRSFPWYMQLPIYHARFEINEGMRAQFINPFEMRILQSICDFQCKLMILDVGPDVPMSQMERWVKFCKYAKVLAVVRCPTMARQLRLLDTIFLTLLMEENLENTWHEELSRSLNAAVRYAKKQHVMENCGVPFVFIFSRTQGKPMLDTFKVMRKF